MKNLNKMKIAPDMQYEIGQDKITLFPAWDIKDDETLCEKVKKLAHSTFDLSKFTKEGEPIITDDGIASGFLIQSKFVKLNNVKAKDLKGKNWTIKAKWVNTNADLSSATTNIEIQPLFSIAPQWVTTGGIAVEQKLNNEFPFAICFAGATYTGSESSNDGTHIRKRYTYTPDYCIATVSFDYQTGEYKLWADVGNGNEYAGSWTPTTSQKELRTIYNEEDTSLRHGAGWQLQLYDAIDLKYTECIIDGVPVFSGNKTGIDTIKPDNYTVVGTPTISADGVVSITGGASNYITTSALDVTSAFKLEFDWWNNTETTSGFVMFGEGGTTFLKGYRNSGGGWYLQINFNNNGSNDYVMMVDNIPMVFNSKYHIVVEYDGNQTYKGTVYRNGVAVGTSTPVTSSLSLRSNKISTIYATAGMDNYIDLNSFKFYSKGNLVYQPCLKIPYTEGINYNKIVDVAYRDRVKDLFEQAGFNGYYTLDEDNHTFTIPSHRFSDVVIHKENDDTAADMTADFIINQHGACTSGTEVTLPIPYADDDYAISVATSAKSATAFTPSETGYWFASGKGTL